MADWTAITGIVVSGAAGPSVIAFWAARRQTREAAHEVALTDRGAARALLDNAVEAVREAGGRAGVVQSAVTTWGNKLGIEGGTEEVQAFLKAGQRVSLLAPRIEVMFGPDSAVTVAYGECLATGERVAGATNLISGAHEATDWCPWLDDTAGG